MKNCIEYVPVNSDYITDALNMVLCAYENERKSIPYLPEGEFYTYLKTIEMIRQ